MYYRFFFHSSREKVAFKSFQSFCPQKPSVEGKRPRNALIRLPGSFFYFKAKRLIEIPVHTLLYE